MRIRPKWIAASAGIVGITAIAGLSATRFIGGQLAHDSGLYDRPMPGYVIAARKMNAAIDAFSLRVGTFIAETATGVKAPSKLTQGEWDALQAESTGRFERITQNVSDLEAADARRIAAKYALKGKPARPKSGPTNNRKGMDALVASVLAKR